MCLKVFFYMKISIQGCFQGFGAVDKHYEALLWISFV